jgi:tetratricopeptide (TPR) repeat protein
MTRPQLVKDTIKNLREELVAKKIPKDESLLNPNLAVVYYNKGNTLYRSMHYEEALATHEQAFGPAAPPHDGLPQIGDFSEVFDFSQNPNYHPSLPFL